jgi:zinc protease
MTPVVLKSRRVLLAAIIIAMVGGIAIAQSKNPPSRGLVLKGRAPINKESLKVTLPRAYETKLGNGLQVIVIEQHKLPTFAMQMVVRSGGMSDPQDAHGAAQFTASLLQEGTKTRTSKEIAEQIDAEGAQLFVTAPLYSNDSRITASGLMDSLDQIMELFADMILNPSFPDIELNKLKTRSLAQLQQQRSQPSFLAAEMFAKVIYGSHPGSREALTAEEIQRMTSEAVRRFHAVNYKPNNAIFAIVGDVKPAEIVAKLEKVFGSWHRGDVPNPIIPKVSQPGPAKIYVIDRASSEQTNLLLGNLIIERRDPDYYALDVMNQIVGGGMSARLSLNLRQDKGFTYSVSSRLVAEGYPGTFRTNTDVRTDVTKGSMQELLYEFKRIRDEKVPQDEFERAKRTIIGRFALQLEYPQLLMTNIINQKLYDLPADYWENYSQKIAAITQDDVQRVAQKYLDLDHLQVIAVGDASKIAEVMKQYGTVEIYDTEGKRVKSAGAGN